eukprot:TRINITY_DN25762_c0_g1_i1.p1 TRINITY_DN25762_c0_g1~~TRINITY_DN25762_c0_g1_i1.p1  ORF type:complete len:283 (+),score=32.62 TRINITY_DN25762_c0_g1_i1:56-850(+)
MALEDPPSLLISEMAMVARPLPAWPGAWASSGRGLSDLGPEQQRALARIAEYPQRVERLKRLWADAYSAAGARHHRLGGSCNSPLGRRPRSGGSADSGRRRTRSTSRLSRAGALVVGSRPVPRAARAASASGGGRRYGHQRSGRRASSFVDYGYAGGPLTATQIRQLMSRELTPEDYELLLLLDEGVKRHKTIDSESLQRLPQARGSAWIGDECRVCLCALEQGEDVRQLPCGHVYHAPCIERWLSSSKATCPVCGADVSEALQ